MAHPPLKVADYSLNTTPGSPAGNNRQNPGPLFHLRHDIEDVVHAETGGFRFPSSPPLGALEKVRNPFQSVADGQGIIFMDILVGLSEIGYYRNNASYLRNPAHAQPTSPKSYVSHESGPRGWRHI